MSSDDTTDLPGIHASPNIQMAPEVYDLENEAADPEGLIEAAMLYNTSVLSGSAERTPLRDRSIDIVQARFAYFFGPGAEPGLAELERLVRPGGAAFIIDNDLRSGTFAAWLRQSPHAPQPDPAAVERFWAGNGFNLERIASEWRFAQRTDLEAVVRLEFGEKLAERLLAGHAGTRVEYHYCLRWRRY